MAHPFTPVLRETALKGLGRQAGSYQMTQQAIATSDVNSRFLAWQRHCEFVIAPVSSPCSHAAPLHTHVSMHNNVVNTLHRGRPGDMPHKCNIASPL